MQPVSRSMPPMHSGSHEAQPGSHAVVRSQSQGPHSGSQWLQLGSQEKVVSQSQFWGVCPASGFGMPPSFPPPPSGSTLPPSESMLASGKMTPASGGLGGTPGGSQTDTDPPPVS